MTISTGVFTFIGRSISIRSRFLMNDTFTHTPSLELISLIKGIIAFTAIFETIGALLLFSKFYHSKTLAEALWSSFFHSISAFCNAGFSLHADSLTAYRSDPVVNLTIIALIITGGLGFLVLNEGCLFSLNGLFLRKGCSRLSLHSKIVVTTTFWLIVLGFFLFFLGEFNGIMKNFDMKDRILASFFQSVTSRTAGFNTLDFASVSIITILGTMILMFIGGSPSSSAGGIKTTTFVALIAVALSHFSGHEQPSLFKRTIDRESVNRSFAIFTLAVSIVIFCSAVLAITELGSKPYDHTNGLFLKHLFEVISAFGTAGLSMGVTGDLSTSGKIVLIIAMFIGRLGPFAIPSAITPCHKKSFYYAEEKIMVG